MVILSPLLWSTATIIPCNRLKLPSWHEWHRWITFSTSAECGWIATPRHSTAQPAARRLLAVRLGLHHRTLIMLIPFTSLRSLASRKRCSDSGAPISCQSDPSAYLLFVNDSRLTHSLEPRKGGGGKGKGSSGSGTFSVTRSLFPSPFPPAHVGGKSGGKTSKVPLKGGSVSNGKKSATSYGAGGGRSAPISLGQPFAGRTAGGGGRSQVYGSRYAMTWSSGLRGTALTSYVSTHVKNIRERLL